MAEPTPNQTKTTEPTPPTPPEPPAPNNGDNQKAIDEALAKAKAEWEKEVEEKLKKAEEEYIVAEDKDSTKAVIDKIKESYDKDVQAGVTERLKGKTPDLNGGSGGHNTGSFMDIIRENQR